MQLMIDAVRGAIDAYCEKVCRIAEFLGETQVT